MTQTQLRQETPNDKPSLDTLNRTIEGLESRLSGLMETHASAPSTTKRHHLPLPEPRERINREILPISTGSVRVDTELREISNTLRELRSSLREDFTASLRGELTSLHDMLSSIDRQTDTGNIDEKTRIELLRIAEGVDWLVSNAAADDDSNLMAEFDHLQTLLRGLADAKSIARLEDRFENLERHLAPFDAVRLDSELIALTEGLDEIKQRLTLSEENRSLNEVEDRLATLAHAMETLCTRIPTSSKRIDGQMGAIERRIEDIDRNLERIGRRQNETVRDPAIERMESRLGELSNAMATVDRQMRDQNAKQVVALDNLNAMACRIEEHSKPDGYLKLEARLEKLATTIEREKFGLNHAALDDAVSQLSGKIDRIDVDGAERRLSSKIETTTLTGFGDEDRLAFKTQIDKLATVVENSNHGIEPHALDEAVARINDKITRIDIESAERRLSSKIESIPMQSLNSDLRRRIESIDPSNFEERISAHIKALDLSGVEKRLTQKIEALNKSDAEIHLLNALAARLDENLTDNSDEALGRLERQVAEMTTLISRPDPKLPFEELEKRLGERIDNLAASNDDYIIEAAQHAAEEALIGFKTAQKGEPDEHIQMITALTADLKTLQQLNRSNCSNDEIAELKATLKTIVSRLDSLSPTNLHTTTRPKSEQIRPKNKLNMGPQTAPIIHEKLSKKVDIQDTKHTTHSSVTSLETFQQKRDIALRSEARKTEEVDPDQKPEKDDSVSETSEKETLKSERQQHETNDVMKILARVRANQTPTSPGPSFPEHDKALSYVPDKKREPAQPAGVKNKVLNSRGPQGGLIAAARRAAVTAVDSIEEKTHQATDVSSNEKSANNTPAPIYEVSRRPVYLAAGAILLALMAYPLLSDFGSKRDVVFLPERTAKAPQHPINTNVTQRPTPATIASEDGPLAVPSLRDPAPRDKLSAFIPEDLAQVNNKNTNAFQMAQTDSDIVTGSIAPNKLAASAQPKAALAPSAKKIISAKIEKKPIIIASVAPASNISTNNGLGVLDKPIAQKTITEAVKTPKPLQVLIPSGLKPAAFAQAAAKGNRDALYEIGMRYEEGAGLTQDRSKAAAFLTESAQRGSIPATFQLGSLYEKGAGVERSPKKAVALYQKAAEAGNISAMHNLAVMQANGAGGEVVNFNAAARWFTDAANHGVADSQFNLAILYARGAGVERNLIQSYKWFAIAALEGDAEAAKRRDEVAEAFNANTLITAKKAVADWQVAPPKASANIVLIPAEWSTPAHATTPIDKQRIIREVQGILNKNGFDAGSTDGLLGAKTDAAIKAFQRINGLDPNGKITPNLVKALLASNSA